MPDSILHEVSLLRISFQQVQNTLKELHDKKDRSLLAHCLSNLVQEVFELKLVFLDRIEQARREIKQKPQQSVQGLQPQFEQNFQSMTRNILSRIEPVP